MSQLAQEVERSIRARRLLLPRQSILLAISGGVDSMVLLDVLLELAPRFHWKLALAHLNHHLRGRDSDRDEQLVRKTAAKLNLPLVVEHADVRKFALDQNLSLEMAARELRHQFLARAARRKKIRQITLAHHADDQLEVFFLRLFRGSGVEGLAGMNWQNPSPFDPKLRLIRPLLEQTKSALQEHAAANRVPFREDVTNQSIEIQRNRIRNELLPLLRKHYQPALSRTVLRGMELLRAEADFVGQVANEWVREIKGTKNSLRPKTSNYSQCPFDELPLALQRRSLQRQLLELGIAPEFETIEQLRAKAGQRVCLRHPSERNGEGGSVPFFAMRDERGLVRVQAIKAIRFSTAQVKIELKGRKGKITFAGARIRWSKARLDGLKQPMKGQAGLERFDAQRVGTSIVLRHWRAGDRFQPSGMSQPIKLQDLFTNAHIPRGARHGMLVAETSEGEIFWVEGLRISERFKLTKRTIRCLHWRWDRF